MSRPRLTSSQKRTALSRKSKGFSTKEVGRQLSMNGSMVDVMFNAGRFTKGVTDPWTPRAGHVTIYEREEIRVGLSRRESISLIARRLGRSPSTVSREVAANGGREHYRIWGAHCRARKSAAPQEVQAATRPPRALRQWVRIPANPATLWSPREISRRLPLDYPCDPEMRVSPGTIYQSLFVQGRGELRRELNRQQRPSHSRQSQRHDLPGCATTSESLYNSIRNRCTTTVGIYTPGGSVLTCKAMCPICGVHLTPSREGQN